MVNCAQSGARWGAMAFGALSGTKSFSMAIVNVACPWQKRHKLWIPCGRKNEIMCIGVSVAWNHCELAMMPFRCRCGHFMQGIKEQKWLKVVLGAMIGFWCHRGKKRKVPGARWHRLTTDNWVPLRALKKLAPCRAKWMVTDPSLGQGRIGVGALSSTKGWVTWLKGECFLAGTKS